MAGYKNISADLSKRYGLYNTLCLRCGIPALSITASFTGPTDCWPDSFFARLCAPCQHEETPSMGPLQMVDGPGWMCATKTTCPVNLKPLLDGLKETLAKLPPVEIVMTKAPRKW